MFGCASGGIDAFNISLSGEPFDGKLLSDQFSKELAQQVFHFLGNLINLAHANDNLQAARADGYYASSA